MNLTVQVELRIRRPASTVFDAIVDPERMAHYFISSGSGRLAPGRTVRWTFADAGAEADVRVHEFEDGRRVTFSWPVAGRDRLVEIDLQPEGDGATEVKVREDGYDSKDDEEVEQFGGQTGGWMNFLCCLKAYLEYDINLRTGMITRGSKDKVAQGAAAAKR